MSSSSRIKSLGFYLSAVVIVLTIIGMIVYPFSINFFLTAEVLLGVVVAAEVLYMVGGRHIKSEHWELISILVSVLLAATICVTLFFQVEQIGWCVSGLDSWSILTTFFATSVVLIIGLVVSVIGCFSKQNKNIVK